MKSDDCEYIEAILLGTEFIIHHIFYFTRIDYINRISSRFSDQL